MPSSFFQSAFDSDPPSPQLSYRDPIQYVKDDLRPGEFSDYPDPFASPEKSLDAIRLREEFESDAVRMSNFGASFEFTLDMLSTPNNSSLGSDSRTEIDDAFINQISCFSDLSTSSVDASSIPSSSSPSLSQASTSTSKPSIDLPSPVQQITDPLEGSTQQKQIFGRSLSWALSNAHTDTEVWVECFGPTTFSGRVINISGWEPPENENYSTVDVDISGWMPNRVAAMRLPTEQGHENQPAKSKKSKSKSSPRSEASKNKSSKTWARRLTSNRPVSEAQKRRCVEGVLPLQNQVVDEQVSVPLAFRMPATVSTESNCSPCDSNPVLPREEKISKPEASLSNIIPKPQLKVPGYIYPLPEVAKAITHRAAEDERERGLAASAQFQEQLDPGQEEDEEMRKLIREFLDLPDDAKDNSVSKEGVNDLLLAKAFDPSHLPSPSSSPSTVDKQNLRPTRSLLDYSASTRRRALVRFRSEVLPRGAVPLIRKLLDEESVNIGRRNEGGPLKPPVFSKLLLMVDSENLGPAIKRPLEDDDALTAQRGTKRVRAS